MPGWIYGWECRTDSSLTSVNSTLRPKFMTVATMFMGLIPIMWATGTGSDVWKRIAAPMVGGIFTSFVLDLVVYPAIYEIWKWYFELKRGRAKSQTLALAALPSLEATP